MAIERIIRAAVERGASDVHIKADDVVRARIDGRLVALTKQSLTAEQTRAIALHFMSTDTERAAIDTLRDHDASWAAPGVGRFRVNILRQRASHSIVMRVIPSKQPDPPLIDPPPSGELVEPETSTANVSSLLVKSRSATPGTM